ncbi:hypothetical protein [Desulfurobacterium crinifex]
MGTKWRRSKLSLTTGFIMSAMLASQGFAQHPAVKLLDLEGNPIVNTLNSTDNVTIDNNAGNETILLRGNPVSFEKTCAQCHEKIVEDVRMSHHGAVGLHDMGWMDGETKGDDTGTKDFVTNVVLKMRYFRSKSHYGGW